MARKDKAARRKRRKDKRDRRLREARRYELYCMSDPADESFLLLRVRYQDGGSTPSASYEGREALDRVRRWCIGMLYGHFDAPDELIDNGWISTPAQGDPEGAWWRQGSSPRGCLVMARLPAMELWTGSCETDLEVGERLVHLQLQMLVHLDELSEEEITGKLTGTALQA